ncbi:aldo/keto reductase [Allonocardiopsis opalescens]|uniref:Aryl-alcohol dehydrogenase-like predicted oxidoreductase n=1 Tax=Allonocardiopsis opalescens TaxID=1144618 RepID=A0A2T0Q4H6_9ACTN|nr:aldo/keto reductase [Allonocardiopsis opalescens]PRX98663.1 aryl-alcohol dehydrogenase-like predicted oxidoreductase [Allonocardiopsis opalescens]
MDVVRAEGSGTFSLGGELSVVRLGYGTMQLTGPGVWGEPDDPDEAVRVLRRAVELGVTFFDTADSYGPYVAERLLKRALHPYADEVVIATKAGFTRPGPGDWRVNGRPDHLRRQVELSLGNLGLDRIDLLQLHRIDHRVPLADQLGALAELREQGKIRHVGLSEVSVDQLRAAERVVPIVSVQNLYNVAERGAEDVLAYCERHGIAFIPWFPLATGALAQPGGPLAAAARRRGATPAQLALAWLLRRSPVMLPIPGTSRVAHLEQNVAAAGVDLSDAEFDAIAAAA